jgi:hypothetical protein
LNSICGRFGSYRSTEAGLGGVQSCQIVAATVQAPAQQLKFGLPIERGRRCCEAGQKIGKIAHKFAFFCVILNPDELLYIDVSLWRAVPATMTHQYITIYPNLV